MKELEKSALLKDKELAKVKRISNKREIEAMKANQIAKQRMDELAQLRLKYKDSEKKLRMASLKRGVLAKAGIDPVIVGRREHNVSPQKSTDGNQHPYSKRTTRGRNVEVTKPPGTIAVDSLRSYFDQKVAGVARKEAIADKLAREWEEHFELSIRKQDLLAQKNSPMIGDISEEIEEAHQALLIQIQFKEERIRQLASRLSKPDETPDDKEEIKVPNSDTFLFGKEFGTICKGTIRQFSKLGFQFKDDCLTNLGFIMLYYCHCYCLKYDSRYKTRQSAHCCCTSTFWNGCSRAQKGCSLSQNSLFFG
jgi:hypothetical protein